MNPPFTPLRFSAFDSLSAADVKALISGARNLDPGSRTSLKSRHVAVLCEDPLSAPAQALAAAASALGAAVVRLQPSALKLADRTRFRETAQLLGQLYGLICTSGLEAAVNTSLALWAEVPVLSDLDAPSNPIQILADLLVMQEHTRQPINRITLGLKKDTDVATLHAWQQVSALTGLKINRHDEPPKAGAAAVGDFHLGCDLHSASAGPPHLVATATAAGPGECLAAQQLNAQHRLLQALMAQVVG